LHESSNFVVDVDAAAPPEAQELDKKYLLTHIGDVGLMAPVTGPLYVGGPSVPLPDTTFGDIRMPLEWSNALAQVVHRFSGQPVPCNFESIDDPNKTVQISLTVRPFFDEADIAGEKTRRAVIAREIVSPGELTQSLCSPWQNDYRECACFYWAATRPDYVNTEVRPDGTSTGNNWMQKDRTPETPSIYVVDDWMDPNLVSYVDLFRHWERSLRFIIGGMDEEALPPELKEGKGATEADDQ
jgi:hypothetical protein